MSDIIDRANDLAHLHNEHALSQVEKPQPIVGTSHCLFCGESLESLKKRLPLRQSSATVAPRFCDADCRDDYEKLPAHLKAK